jgi:hypothetical protein
MMLDGQSLSCTAHHLALETTENVSETHAQIPTVYKSSKHIKMVCSTALSCFCSLMHDQVLFPTLHP